MAQLKWGGKVSPKAFIVAETPEEVDYIRQQGEYPIVEVDGRTAYCVSATLPIDEIFNLKRKVSLGPLGNTLFPGRVISIPNK